MQVNRRSVVCGQKLGVAILVAASVLGVARRGESERQSAAAATGTADYQQLATTYKKTPSPQILYQLGTLAVTEGRLTEAQDLMRRYLAELSADPNAADYKEAAQVVARPRGPSGEVDILGDRGGLIFVDERLVGALPLTLPLLLSAGDHQIVLERGRRHVKAPIKILDGRGAVMRFNADSNAVLVSQPPAVVILPELSTSSDLSPRLLQTVEKAVRRANQAVFNTAVARARAPEQNNCQDSVDCQVKLGQRNEVDYVMTLRIKTAGAPTRPDYLLTLKLLDVSAADYSAQVEHKCAACDPEQLVSDVGATAKELLHTGVGRARGTLAITSEPTGATVHAAGRELGTTPYRGPTWAGNQALTVTLSGYKDEPVAALVPAGDVVTYTLRLKPGSTPTDSGLILGRPRKRFIAGGVVGGVGIILLAVGGNLLSSGLACIDITGSGVCSGSNAQAIAGGSILGLGLVLGGTGALLMALPAKSK